MGGERLSFKRPVVRATTLILTLLSLALLVPREAVAVAPGHDAFNTTWSRTDRPVAAQSVSRTWMWGPQAFTGAMLEQMNDAPGGGRTVQYFDKSRMEIATDPAIDPNSIWYVTNGLLASEMVKGELQVGLAEFEPRDPAEVNVAGDPDDPAGPTYATFSSLVEAPPFADGAPLTARVARDGTITDDPTLAGQGAVAAEYVSATDHRVASPFWEFMNSGGVVWNGTEMTDGQLFPNPYYATGFPISEAYWATVLVGGESQDVLIQVFERRVLTYTPGNQPGWQVEAGNVGQHYYRWRYNTDIPAEPPALPEGAEPLGPTPLPQASSGARTARVVIANAAPESLTVTFSGVESRTVELPPCPDCQVTPQPPASCAASAPSETLELPPGVYTVVSSRPGGDSPDLAGTWTFVPDHGYGACFFVIDT